LYQLTFISFYTFRSIFVGEGGIDLLLHLLSNIADLPVTKSIVKSSGMGKAVGSVEKHRIVVGSPNESAIKERVQKVKDAWHASVKARKGQSSSKDSISGIKRPIESASESPSSAKRVKAEDEDKKVNSFSSLLKTVSGSDGLKTKSNATPEKSSSPSKSETAASKDTSPRNGDTPKSKAKTASKRVKWADHFGGILTASQVIEGEEQPETVPAADVSVSWSDRKKRDRMREKELLANAK